MKNRITMFVLLVCSTIMFSQVTKEFKDMQWGGPFAGIADQNGLSWVGVGLFGNGDNAYDNFELGQVPGTFEVAVRGISTDGTDAYATVFVQGTPSGVLTFDSLDRQTQTIEVNVYGGNTNPEIRIEVTADTGINDIVLERITITRTGDAPPQRTVPIISDKPAFETGEYRNVFVDAGYSEEAVAAKLNKMWEQYFVSGSEVDERQFYEFGDDMGYIFTDNLDQRENDIRSEGMSYAMMIAVQLNKREVFNKLWRFAKAYSQWAPGTAREGLFAWQVALPPSLRKIDPNSAPDGELYYAAALYFADARWGSTQGSGAFDSAVDVMDYRAQADYILDSMFNKADTDSGACPTNLVNEREKQIVFGICGFSARFTDPSYHLPAFYEIFARYANSRNDLWSEMAAVSRTFLLPASAHPITGLIPDYTEFDGTPRAEGSTHDRFEFDAWRNIMNISFDQVWFKKNTDVLVPIVDKQIDFFDEVIARPETQGRRYASIWTLDGTFSRKPDEHSEGLVACNATAALVLADEKAWAYVDELFATPIVKGRARYYNGLLYMMSYMHLAGEFKILKPDFVAINKKPVANAGTNSNTTDAQVTLDGSESFDLDGSIVSYSWALDGEVIATESIATIDVPLGATVITLTVTDNKGATAQDSVTITRTSEEVPNILPVANAGINQTTQETQIVLNGNGSSDEDGDIVSYVWTENGEAIATGSNPEVSLSVGSHEITLTVTDNDNGSDQDTVTVIVQEVILGNIAPVANAGSDIRTLSENVVLDGSGSSDSDGTIASYVWSENGIEIGTGVSPTVSLSIGVHVITLTVTDNEEATNAATVTVTVNEPRAAFAVHNIPGVIEAEAFDLGGAGVSFRDVNADNLGGEFRDTAVDIEVASDNSLSGPQFNVGFIANGEWLEYTIATVLDGVYDLSFRVASDVTLAKGIVANIQGNDYEVSVPSTDGWQQWQTITVSDVALNASTNEVLRLDFIGGSFNINTISFTFKTVIESMQTPFSAHVIPGVIEAEDFDNGGQDVAYFDLDDENQGGAVRSDEGVDIEVATDTNGGFNVGYIVNGEWLEYTIGSIEKATYDITFRIASNMGNAKSILATLGANQLGSIAIPNTNGWQSWQNVTIKNVAIDRGVNQVLRLNFVGDYFNLNNITFEKVTPVIVIDTDQETSIAGANLDFELGNFSNWDGSWGELKNREIISSGDVYAGNYSAKITGNASAIQRVFGLDHATTYELTGYAKVGQEGQSGVIGVKNQGENSVSTLVTSTSWTEYTITFTTGRYAKEADIYLQASQNNVIFGDNFTITLKQQGPKRAKVVLDSSFVVYPNPTNDGVVNVELSDYKNTKLTVYNLMGAKVYATTLSQPQVQLDLEAGVYIITVFKNESTLIERLVIQ